MIRTQPISLLKLFLLYIKILKPPPKILWLHVAHQLAIVQGSSTQRFSSLSLTYQRQINRDDVKIPPYWPFPDIELNQI